jgi:ParB-like chromosome segregation protein Spo0J
MEVTLEGLDLSFGRLRAIPTDAIERMTESLRLHGQLSPIAVSGDATRWIVVDGFVRRLAARSLGWTTLRGDVVTVTGPELRAQMYLRNRERGFLFIEECRLVHELCRGEGLAQVEAAAILERHKSWVCRRLAVYDGLAPALRDGGGLLEAISGGSLSRLALLPARNQEELHAVWLVHELAPSECQELITAYCRAAAPEARRFVVEQPRQAQAIARAEREARLDPRLGQASQAVADGLLTLEHLGVKQLRTLREGVEPPGPEAVITLTKALTRAETRTHELFRAVRTWLSKADAPAPTGADA